MEMENNGTPRTPVSHHKRRNHPQRSLKLYLPLLAIAAILILFIGFAANSLHRSSERREQAQKESLEAAQAEALQLQKWAQEASSIATQAELLAACYDYDAAVALIDTFSGNFYDYDSLVNLRDTCISAKNSLTVWEDPSVIPHLSFHPLIADPQRAFADAVYSGSYQYHHLTVTEFRTILQQLYVNGYVLVSFEDVITSQQGSDGSISYGANPIYLPAGKKPILITQTQPNYYAYMVDGDGDGIPDKDGGGFASRLMVDPSGKLTCEMVDSTGATVTGSFDLVPILEEFIAAHPDFSYRGARATLALSGFEGLFGYRTTPETATKLSQSYYDQQVQGASEVIAALRERGYRFACYTYGNIGYGDASVDRIRADLEKWSQEVVPLLGKTELLVFAKSSDISKTNDPYSGDKYALLRDAGFRCFLGFCSGSTPWATISGESVRQGRLMVTGYNLENNPAYFKGLFDATAVLDSIR